ncbi:MAG: acetolactate synthase [Streptosporangiaceae bacterium]
MTDDAGAAEHGAAEHGGAHAVAAARAHGVAAMFTLSGGHVFPLYDGAVRARPPMPIVDVRHEQTAVFAAEGTARLTRTPGLAVLTAGPGVTNGISAITTAHFNGSPVVVLAGRAPDYRWGSGSLQELDHPALVRPVTKRAWTEHDPAGVGPAVASAFELAAAAHRGPVFLDASLEALYGTAGPVSPPLPGAAGPAAAGPEPGAIAEIAGLLAQSSRPVLVLGSDVWLGGAAEAARGAAEQLRLPVITNGQARGILPAGHELLMSRARSTALAEADLVIVAGTPLDFRLGYGEYGGRDGAPRARVVHVADAPGQVAAHCELAASAAGDLTAFFTGLADASAPDPAREQPWLSHLVQARQAAMSGDRALLAAAAAPIHPLRVYGELAPLLEPDAVIIGDGGDFVSYAGKYLEPRQAGGWLDPGPYGCLGTGLGYAIAARIARPGAQVVLLLGDGAAGFSLMDADTLVRHRLPVVMICGNNGIWGLEKHPMQALYGYDVAAELQPACRYDEVVTALGGAGETVTDPGEIGPALRRAFTASCPYLVNVITDPQVAYPRSTTGV